MLNNAKSYTDRQVSKVGAASAALAGLHYLDYNPNDKWSFATSLGHYKHSTAGAIGASYQPNENSMVHAGVTVGGERMFNIGASFKVGEQDPTLKTSRFEMAKQIKDLQADNASLRADNEELRAEVNEIKAALKNYSNCSIYNSHISYIIAKLYAWTIHRHVLEDIVYLY